MRKNGRRGHRKEATKRKMLRKSWRGRERKPRRVMKGEAKNLPKKKAKLKKEARNEVLKSNLSRFQWTIVIPL